MNKNSVYRDIFLSFGFSSDDKAQPAIQEIPV